MGIERGAREMDGGKGGEGHVRGGRERTQARESGGAGREEGKGRKESGRGQERKDTQRFERSFSDPRKMAATHLSSKPEARDTTTQSHALRTAGKENVVALPYMLDSFLRKLKFSEANRLCSDTSSVISEKQI
jgi:hypothetical protein